MLCDRVSKVRHCLKARLQDNSQSTQWAVRWDRHAIEAALVAPEVEGAVEHQSDPHGSLGPGFVNAGATSSFAVACHACMQSKSGS